MTKKPGRPKVYESSSEKLEAYRRRHESAGFIRREVMVTREVWDRITDLAGTMGVSASVAASGLLEHGLKTYRPRVIPPVTDALDDQAYEVPAFLRRQAVDNEPVLPARPSPRPRTDAIQAFFNKRKESISRLRQIEQAADSPSDPSPRADTDPPSDADR